LPGGEALRLRLARFWLIPNSAEPTMPAVLFEKTALPSAGPPTETALGERGKRQALDVAVHSLTYDMFGMELWSAQRGIWPCRP